MPEHNEMSAVFFSEKGGTDKLIFGRRPRPEPRHDEVLIKVMATSVNHLDITTRDGTARIEFPLPHIPGCDAVGVIRKTGGAVTGFSEGETVAVNPGISCGNCNMCLTGRESLCPSFHILGEHVDGAYAEYVCVPARNLIRVPSGYPFIKAAAAPLVYLTAWHALVSRANIGFGENVLISGGSGGVSTAAIQIAKLFDAHVAVTTRNEAKAAKLSQLGADEVILVSSDWSKNYISERARGFDIILDSLGSAQWRDHLRLLNRGGRLVNYGITTGGAVDMSLAHLFWKQQSVIGSTMGDHRDFETSMRLVFSGRLEPVVDRVFSLRDASAAQEYVATGSQVGKVVIVNGETQE